MSEETKQRSYRTLDVLVEGARVLSSSYPTIGVILTGQELEILRNLMNYTQTRGMFVGEYHPNYYLSVDDDDWLAIETILGALEGKLMGNDNVIWGVNDTLHLVQAGTDVGGGTYDQLHTAVPEGETWVITGVSWLSLVAGGSVHIYARQDVFNYPVTKTQTWTVDEWSNENGLFVVLTEADRMLFSFYDLAAGQHVKSIAYGYKMKVEA